MKAAFFISDVHLRRMASPSGEAMLSLVKKAQKEASLFVILGDLFDLWVGKGEAFQREYASLITEFEKLKNTCHILYFEGNHDFHLEKFWQHKMGFEILTGPKLIDFAGVKIWAEHGDEINRRDYGYLFLRYFLRFWPVRKVIENVPSQFVFEIGSRASHVSRKYTDRKPDPVKDIFRAYALDLRSQNEFSLLVTGHSHVEDDFEFEAGDGKRARLINLGSWFEAPHFLRVSSSGEIADVKI